MGLDDSISEYCNQTLHSFVSNLTSSYADQRNEATMVATSVTMFALATLFFNLNLFSRLSDVSAILNPSVRFFLSASLSLFLPVMSYLFSEAKNNATSWASTELSLRARTILLWMLLVELLRKKVEAIMVSAGVPGYPGTVERAARIIGWLGYLVFYNLRSAGKKALYGALWVLAAAKLLQRLVTLELGKRSFAYGKNPQLVATYMAHILQEEDEQQVASNNGMLRGSELLKRCNYVVMGEEDLEKKAGPSGYQLLLDSRRPVESIAKADSTVVTVGKIWELAEADKKAPFHKDPRLKKMCLSLALYKLLRRRLEDFPITAAEAHNCRSVIFNGLCEEAATDTDGGEALFQVLNDEVQFLCEYYHAVHPVVFSSPFFFLANYVLFPVVVWAFCVLTAILSSHGDVLYAFHSFKRDNYALMVGILRMTRCVLVRLTKSPTNLFSSVDIFITILLLLAFAYEEVWELMVFLLSNWFLVSLLCSYTTSHQSSPLLSRIVRGILWVRNTLNCPSVCFKQCSVLWHRRLPLFLPTKAVPREAKKAIMQRLANATTNPLSNGRSAVQSDERVSWACESASLAEVILTWHIATTLLLQEKEKTKKPSPGGADHNVAAALSGYCMYLVAYRPELLPDDKDGTERVYRDTVAELKKEMGRLGYYCSFPYGGAWSRKMAEIAGRQQRTAEEEEGTAAASVLRKGAKLGKVLIERAATEEVDVWKQLAELWTEVLVYAAPAAGELHVKAHKEALAQGGEFITLLWALATHTGIARPLPAAACV
ncbi:hypothetical protein EJB05_33258, partial [Eragrostis curvula]